MNMPMTFVQTFHFTSLPVLCPSLVFNSVLIGRAEEGSVLDICHRGWRGLCLGADLDLEIQFLPTAAALPPLITPSSWSAASMLCHCCACQRSASHAVMLQCTSSSACYARSRTAGPHGTGSRSGTELFLNSASASILLT